MIHKGDVVVIGGGIVGCAPAYYLAKRGIKDVIVLEASESIGHGGSSRNGGGVRQSGRDVRELPIAMYGIKNFWPTLSEELGVDTEYTQKGNLRLGKTEKQIEKLTTLAGNAQSVGLDVTMIDGKEVRKINPYLSEEIVGASWCPTDGHANPLTTTLGFYKRSLEMGVRFFTGAEVVELRKIKGRVRQVITKEGDIFEGGDIILAAGYESRYIMNTVGLDIPMTKYLDSALVTEMQPKMFEQMLGTADADFYGHQSKHGSFVFGADCGLEGYVDMPLTRTDSHPMTLSASCRAISGYIPLLAKAKIVRTWTGWMEFTPDGVCVLGRPQETPGLILATAFNGHGFGTAPAVGYMMAQIVAGEETAVDIKPLRYERFVSNK